MGFEAKIKTKPGSHVAERELNDTTGSKTADNPDGWGDGTTNPMPSQVTAATISFYFADGSQALSTSVFNPSTPFPNNINTSAFLLSTALSTPQGSYPDGLVDVEYRVDGEWLVGGVKTAFFSLSRSKEFFFQNVQCCVNAAGSLVNNAEDPCSHPLWNKFIYANRQLQGLKNAIECLKWNQATQILTRLQEFCNTNNLNCGC